MKKLWMTLLALALLIPSARADVLVELEDEFWKTHQSSCQYLYREYTANGPEGYLTLWESPQSSTQRENLPNGEGFSSLWSYTDGQGETWLAVSGGFDQVRGWAKGSECIVTPDYLTFEEAHGAEFVPYDGTYDHAFDDLDTVVLWTYPGSGEIAWADCDTQWFRESVTPAQAFQNCWEDGEGRMWAFVGYIYGERNVWLCLSDPAAQDLPAAPLDPEEAPVPPVGEVPAPTTPIPWTAVGLVVLAAVVTAALIPWVCRRREPKAEEDVPS